ncbi:MAG: class I SAM-dependent methyltransferase [Lysobacteraceae bacterium]|nr:MAG: class I SAM-dependent methyltransferase [Xanthomonadaceae bacterium]
MSRSSAPTQHQTRARCGHVVRDLASRDLKAVKIARLIGVQGRQPSRRMLEVGTGSGGIAHFFGTSGAMGWDVDAVDVEDSRLVSEGFRFTTVDGVVLPFADDSFDVVVSNHVIEHVGEATQQVQHLRELFRVMRADGIGYLAVPSRWMLVEPHFKLPFLSWLPQPLADSYVRMAKKGDYYDCRPLTVHWLESKLDEAGFAFTQHHADALRLTYDIERRNSVLYRWLLKPLPDFVYRVLRRVFPTLIYTLARKQECEHSASSLSGRPRRSTPR